MEVHISKVLDQSLKNLGAYSEVHTITLEESFRKVVGEALAAYCRPIRLNRGTLTVATSHPALSQQLQSDSVVVIENLNSLLKSPFLPKLLAKFHLGQS